MGTEMKVLTSVAGNHDVVVAVENPPMVKTMEMVAVESITMTLTT
jgi:uncharacterized protein with GYD domain